MIGERLYALRTKAGMSKSKLAVKAGVTYHSIANYEAGRRTPTADVIVSLCRVLHVSADYLLGLSPEPTSVSTFMHRTQVPAAAVFSARDKLAQIVEELTTILEE